MPRKAATLPLCTPATFWCPFRTTVGGWSAALAASIAAARVAVSTAVSATKKPSAGHTLIFRLAGSSRPTGSRGSDRAVEPQPTFGTASCPRTTPSSLVHVVSVLLEY